MGHRQGRCGVWVLYLMQWKLQVGFKCLRRCGLCFSELPWGLRGQEGDRGPAGGPSVGGERLCLRRR